MYHVRVKGKVWRVRFPANKQLKEIHYHYDRDGDYERDVGVSGKLREIHFHFRK